MSKNDRPVELPGRSPNGAVPAPAPPDESGRLVELRDAAVLDTESEEIFDRAVQLASQIARTPIALVSLVDETRQWFKAAVGLEARETPRDLAFCAHAILDPSAMFQIEDATADPRFATNPLVVGGPFIKFYAGFPLVTLSGRALGTLCVIDRVPRSLDAAQKRSLESLAFLVAGQLDLRILGARHSRAHDRLAQAEIHASSLQQFLTIFQNAAVGIVSVAADRTITDANPAYAQIVGILPEEIRGRDILAFTHPDDAQETLATHAEMVAGRMPQIRSERRYIRASGEVIWVSVSSSCVIDEDTGDLRMIALVHDVTEQMVQREALAHSASHDPLTGVANRALLESTLQGIDRRLEHPDHHLALLYVDLDAFKAVNDTYGHAAGDQLLKAVAGRIQGALRPEDLVARLGGDEFAILCVVGSPTEAGAISDRLQTAMAAPFMLDDDRTLAVSFSVGVAVSGKGQQAYGELLSQADQAMYRAKRSRRGQVATFGTEDN